MVKKFHYEMASLKDNVLDMGNLAVDMLKKSVEALKNQDTQLADWVNSQKERINDYDHEIEQKCLTLIALYQPMAKDMRAIAAALKMITSFYRIGRYGKDIANLVPEVSDRPHIANLMSIPHMAEVVFGMITDTLTAFEREDITFLKDIVIRDDTVDALRYSMFRECIIYMMEDPQNISQCTNYIMITRYLERCGDHACKIAEKVHYMVTGERIELK